MTCRYSGADWRDVFYNAIRNADGGVVEAAKFLTERRERFIHAEDLRRRLRGADGETLSTEMLELLSEWLLDRREPGALRWLQVFNARFGMAAAHLPPPPEGGWACEAAAIQKKIMQITAENGLLANIGMRVTADKRVDDQECDELEAQCMQIIELVFRLRRNARRAAGRSEDFT